MANPTNNSNSNSGVTWDSQPIQQPVNVNAPAGVTFDSAPITQPVTINGSTVPNTPSSSASVTPSANPPSNSEGPGSGFFGNLGADTIEGLGNAYDGFSKGTAETALGVGRAIRAIPGVGPILGENGLDTINASSAQGANQPIQGVGGALGYGLDNLAEFILGDKTLSGLASSERLLKASKAAKAVEGSPLLQKALSIGMSALKAGTVQGAIGLTKTGGDVDQAVGQGVVAGGLVGLTGTLGSLYQAARAARDVSALQTPLQTGIRSIVNKAANEAGVTPASSTSIRDAVQSMSDSLEAKASTLYKGLDDASGGKIQRFDKALKNIKEEMSNSLGLDDDRDLALLKRQQDIETAKESMLQELEAKGYDRDDIARARAMWRQQGALNDLSASIRQSTTGLRPELAATAKGATKGATIPETVNPKTLSTKLNRLNDSRINGGPNNVPRLVQAIGRENADALLQHVDNMQAQAQRIADQNKWVGRIMGATGSLGGIGYGVHLAHELLGGQ